MKLLFVSSNLIGSRVIRWALKDKCSHFAVCFDEQANGSGIVFHSIGHGATLEWFGHFRKRAKVVHALSFTSHLTLQDEESIYQGMLSQYSGQGYDFKALLFWTWHGALWRFFGRELPKKNGWAVDGYNLCTGLAGGIKWIRLWADENKVDLEMIGPGELCRALIATGYLTDDQEWCELQAQP